MATLVPAAESVSQSVLLKQWKFHREAVVPWRLERGNRKVMNICSVIVHAKPEHTAAVQSRLAGLPGVDVQGGDQTGKFIVTVEDADGVSAADTMMSFNSVEGVISSTLIYHYGGEDLDEEVIREAN